MCQLCLFQSRNAFMGSNKFDSRGCANYSCGDSERSLKVLEVDEEVFGNNLSLEMQR